MTTTTTHALVTAALKLVRQRLPSASQACVVLLLLLAARYWRFVRRFRALPVPGPDDHWLFGSLLTLHRLVTAPRTDGLPGIRGALNAFQDLRRAHGDVVKLRLASDVFVACFSADAVRAVRNSRKHSLYERIRIIAGDGMVFADGPQWTRLRKMLGSAFAGASVRQLAPRFQSTLDEAVDAVRAQPDNVDVSSLVSKCTQDAIARAGLGFDMGCLQGRNLDAHAAFEGILPLVAHPLCQFFGNAGARIVRLLRRKQMRAADDVVHAAIAQRRSETAEARVSRQSEGKDLLDALLEARDDDGVGLSDKELQDQVRMLLVAGAETGAITLQWCLAHLAESPRIWQRLQEELRSVCPNGERPSFDQLRELKFMKQVLNETLRLYPPSFLAPRELAQDTVLGGRTVAAGTPILVVMGALHRDPRFWKSPDAFDPDANFGSPAALSGRAPEQFVPFAFGERACAGKMIFWTEARMLLAELLREFDALELLNEGGVPNFTLEKATIHPAEPIRIRFTPASARR